ncbi:hypothetical protein TNCV_939401 [Trichonephila clavipes]|nr:hypothetical protein TNCV_939401 [Trichonephila clavipes]
MSRFGGLSEERPSVFKTRSKLGTHLLGDERQSRPCASRNRTPDLCCLGFKAEVVDGYCHEDPLSFDVLLENFYTCCSQTFNLNCVHHTLAIIDVSINSPPANRNHTHSRYFDLDAA